MFFLRPSRAGGSVANLIWFSVHSPLPNRIESDRTSRGLRNSVQVVPSYKQSVYKQSGWPELPELSNGTAWPAAGGRNFMQLSRKMPIFGHLGLSNPALRQTQRSNPVKQCRLHSGRAVAYKAELPVVCSAASATPRRQPPVLYSTGGITLHYITFFP